MALNIATKIEKSAKSNTLSKQFMVKHHITVNQPAQTHFSVEGVQTYSRQEIMAIKMREDRLMTAAQKEGIYVKPQSYKIDDQIQFQIPTQSNNLVNSIKAKTKKVLQPAKPNEILRPQTTHKIVKPSIKNQLGRANQKLIKLDKEQAKKEKLQQKLQELSKHYKQHFGQGLKKSKKIIQEDEQQSQNKSKLHSSKRQSMNNNEEVADVYEDTGDQFLPQIKNKAGKSIITGTQAQQKCQDDSFESVQWQKASQTSKSRLNTSTYSQKLGNAVHLLFD